MVSKILSATVIGLDAYLVNVEVHFSKGRSKFFIVGLPDKACSESKERVSAILKNYLGKRLPAGTITVNLSPANIQKTGPVYDLPITLGILHVLKKCSFDTQGKLFIGEMSLDGSTRYTNAILPIADLAVRKGMERLYIPKVNATEASILPKINIQPVTDLEELIHHLETGTSFKMPVKKAASYPEKANDTKQDFSYIIGQSHAKRALEIAAAGSHNVLLIGPPGSGKTLLARSVPSILPDLTFNESIEITRVYSVAGMLNRETSIVLQRPFRKPHHTISNVALVGGGTIPKPGEVSLAHRGVLFLDEFSEFSGKALEALRQPLEDGTITISRAKGALTYPAKLMLIASMNPCKCGWYGDDKNQCTCTPIERLRYNKKISGPILDRIDLQVKVKRISSEKLQGYKLEEPSQRIKTRVQRAKNLQRKRFLNTNCYSNSEMSQKEINAHIRLSKSCKDLLLKAMDILNLSARSYFRVIKVSRTIADLGNDKVVNPNHIKEALSYRLDK